MRCMGTAKFSSNAARLWNNTRAIKSEDFCPSCCDLLKEFWTALAMANSQSHTARALSCAPAQFIMRSKNQMMVSHIVTLNWVVTLQLHLLFWFQLLFIARSPAKPPCFMTHQFMPSLRLLEVLQEDNIHWEMRRLSRPIKNVFTSWTSCLYQIVPYALYSLVCKYFSGIN